MSNYFSPVSKTYVYQSKVKVDTLKTKVVTFNKSERPKQRSRHFVSVIIRSGVTQWTSSIYDNKIVIIIV